MRKVLILASNGGCVELANSLAKELAKHNKPIQVYVSNESIETSNNLRFLDIGKIDQTITFLEEKPIFQKRSVIPNNFYKSKI